MQLDFYEEKCSFLPKLINSGFIGEGRGREGRGEAIRNNDVKRGYKIAWKYVEHTFSRPKLSPAMIYG